MPDVNLTIDGKKLSVPAGTLIVEAAKTIGIEIPVFCYHHKLDPVGACRLCLVDFSPGPPRPQTACTTPVSEGMVVRTQSAMAVQARADILEFELANHPLDCPVCDKGGECPLQDFTFRHGYPSRLRTPLVAGRKSTWADAINAVAAGIKGKGAKLGVSLPQDITNEEAFLFRRLLDGPLKGAKVKMHGRTAIPAPAGATMRIRELDDARVIVVVASDLENDVPIIDLRVKKAVSKRGA